MKYVFITLIAALCGAQSLAQDAFWNEADRPGRSISANTVGKGMLQFNMAYTYEDLDRIYRETSEIYEKNNIGELKLRYGISPRIELSTRMRYTHYDQTSNEAFVSEPVGLIDYAGLAGRYAFIEPSDDDIQVSAEVELIFHDWQNDWASPQFKWAIAASGAVGEKLYLTGNLIYSYWSILSLTANLRYDMSKNISAFFEFYPQYSFDNGSQSNGREYWKYSGESYLNAGVGIALSPRVMVDVSGGLVLPSQPNKSDYYTRGYNVQIGLSTRFGKLN